MVNFLVGLGLIGTFAGVMIFVTAQSAIHEIEAGISILIAVVCFVGAGIIRAIKGEKGLPGVVWGVFAVVGIIVVVAAFRQLATTISRQEDQPLGSSQDIHQRNLYNGQAMIPVSFDRATCDEIQVPGHIEAKDLVKDGKVFFVTTNTPVQVLTEEDGATMVTILAGDKKDWSGWVSSSWFQKN